MENDSCRTIGQEVSRFNDRGENFVSIARDARNKNVNFLKLREGF